LFEVVLARFSWKISREFASLFPIGLAELWLSSPSSAFVVDIVANVGDVAESTIPFFVD
jgi:hypothetical protein